MSAAGSLARVWRASLRAQLTGWALVALWTALAWAPLYLLGPPRGLSYLFAWLLICLWSASLLIIPTWLCLRMAPAALSISPAPGKRAALWMLAVGAARGAGLMPLLLPSALAPAMLGLRPLEARFGPLPASLALNMPAGRKLRLKLAGALLAAQVALWGGLWAADALFVGLDPLRVLDLSGAASMAATLAFHLPPFLLWSSLEAAILLTAYARAAAHTEPT
jgi:hypothetical protein